MTGVIKGNFLEKYRFDIIDPVEGEIVRINENGIMTRDNFIPENCYYNCAHGYYGFYDKADPDGYLLEVRNMFGITQEDMIKLFEVGYTDEEIEVMLEVMVDKTDGDFDYIQIFRLETIEKDEVLMLHIHHE